MKQYLLILSQVLLLVFFITIASCSSVANQKTKSETWILISMNDNPLIEGSQITLILGDDTAYGSAGCNSYSSQIQINEDKVAITHIMNTEMACFEPEGILLQENEYISLLHTVNRIHRENDILTLFKDDTPLLRYAYEPPIPTASLLGQAWI